MKFCFIVLGTFDVKLDRAVIHDGVAQIVGVSTIDEACTIAKQLLEEGVGCIELCGAFGEEGAKQIIEATENKIPVGYITHLPQQDDVYQAAFGL